MRGTLLSVVAMCLGTAQPADVVSNRFQVEEALRRFLADPGDELVAVTGVVEIDEPVGWNPLRRRLHLDGGGEAIFLLFDSPWRGVNHDAIRLNDRYDAIEGPLHIRAAGTVGHLRVTKEVARELFQDEDRREVRVLKVAEWFEIDQPFATEPARLPPPYIKIYPGSTTFWVQQRDDIAVPRSHARVRLRIGDVTEEEVRVEVTADHDIRLIDPATFRPGDAKGFDIDGQSCRLELLGLSDDILGLDHAQFRLTVTKPPATRPATTTRAVESGGGGPTPGIDPPPRRPDNIPPP